MNDFNEELPVSKSQLKREAHAAQELGERLVDLKPSQLKKLSLSDNIYQAIIHAQSLQGKHGALKRQLQYLGKLMREVDSNEISLALEKLIQPHKDDVKRLHQIEKWRDRLVAEGDSALNVFFDNYEVMDRQLLRQLVRNSQAKDAAQSLRAKRKLFQLIEQSIPVGS